MRIGFIQTAPVFGDKEVNFHQVNQLSGGLKADLLVLPELFATGYAFTSTEEAARLSEPADGPTAGFLKQLSTDTGAVIVAGFAENEAGRIFNSSLIVYDGRVIGTYRKLHLFNREKLWFTPGDKPLEVHEINGMRIGVMICFDWIFPEVMRTLALKGAQVIAHPSNLVMPYCQKAMVTRCLENRLFAVTANRTGREVRGEDDFLFTGQSQVTAFNGEVLLSGAIGETAVSIVETDLLKADNKEINPFNNLLGDRRAEFYW
jgi:predicted amidohydrolase